VESNFLLSIALNVRNPYLLPGFRDAPTRFDPGVPSTRPHTRPSSPTASLFSSIDPRTTRLDPGRPAGATRYIRTPFAGNLIPSNIINPDRE
jgi:hypothetical protein